MANMLQVLNLRVMEMAGSRPVALAKSSNSTLFSSANSECQNVTPSIISVWPVVPPAIVSKASDKPTLGTYPHDAQLRTRTHAAELEAVHLAIRPNFTDNISATLQVVMESLGSRNFEATLSKARQRLQMAMS
jgi:hypothetical protein